MTITSLKFLSLGHSYHRCGDSPLVHEYLHHFLNQDNRPLRQNLNQNHLRVLVIWAYKSVVAFFNGLLAIGFLYDGVPAFIALYMENVVISFSPLLTEELEVSIPNEEMEEVSIKLLPLPNEELEKVSVRMLPLPNEETEKVSTRLLPLPNVELEEVATTAQ